jgi:hypothetical protein
MAVAALAIPEQRRKLRPQFVGRERVSSVGDVRRKLGRMELGERCREPREPSGQA